MTFTYPAVVKKISDTEYEGYFPDLEMCEFKGETLDDALDDAHDSMYEWIRVELEEEDEPKLPHASDESEINLAENESLHHIMIHYRFSIGWDE